MDIFNEINESGTSIMLVTHDVKVAARTERVIYMIDGKIEGEFNLRKYDRENNDLKQREAQLSQWLSVAM